MKILILGSSGQLGTDMYHISQQYGYSTKGLDYPEVDITNRASLEKEIIS